MLQAHRLMILVLLAFTFLWVSAPHAHAQGAVTTGTLAGQVYDDTGAVIPGANVAIENEATGLKREAMTDAKGNFSFPQLPAGKYVVTVRSEGFRSARIPDVILNVGETSTLRLDLAVGQVTETVEVSAEDVAKVEITRTEVSGVIQEAQVRELPLNQRSFTSLVTQEPGLLVMTNASGDSTQTPTTVAFSQGSQISANGQVSQSMAYLMDGVNINNSGFGAPGTAAGGDVPGVEGIQEFRVLSHNYSASYGGSAGAVVSFATRSGGNKVHGSVYEFLRNDIFDARDYFDRLEEQPPYRRNQFGATLGGPIVKDKMFIFGNYEGLRSRLTTTDRGTVPSLDARNGGVGGTSGFPVTDELGNPVAISPGVQAILDLYPLPNGVDFGNGIAELFFQNRQPVRSDYGLLRYDWVMGNRDTFMARYSVTDADGRNDYFLPTYEFVKSSRIQQLLLKWTHTFGNNLVNTLSYGFVRSATTAVTQPTVPLQPEQYTGNVAREVVGTISVGSATSGNTSGSLSTVGLDNWGPFYAADNTFPLNDDLIYTYSSHTLKFGAQFIPYQWNWSKGNLIGGGWTFNNLNDLLAGNPAVLIIRTDDADPTFGYRTKRVAWYVEDAWRLKSNLTLTLGLRHEFQVPVLSEVNGKLGNWKSRDDTAQTIGDPYHNYSLKQFQPRVGIAYDPFRNGKTVIRAGFGLFNDFIPLAAVAGELSYNDPLPTLNAFFGAPIAPGFLPQIEFPACSTCTVATGYAGLLTGVLEPVRAPTSMQWNVQLERELPAAMKVSATYTGSHTYNIMRGVEGNANLPCGTDEFGRNLFPPACASVGTGAPGILSTAFTLYAVVWDAHTFYHAGTIALNRAFRNGLSFNTSYAFAKGISESDTNNSGAILLGNASHTLDPWDRTADRSESMFSIRHRFTLNAIYELPFGRGKPFLGDIGGVADAIVGGWSINSLAEVRSGIPFSVLVGPIPINGVNDTLTYPDRPNLVGNPENGAVDTWFDPTAYQMGEPGHLGTAPRNSVRGPTYRVWDFSVSKKFDLTERADLTFRAEFFNVLNHPNFDLPFNQLYTPRTPTDTNITRCSLTPAQQALYSCNPQAGIISRTVGTPRQVQFALKLTF